MKTYIISFIILILFGIPSITADYIYGGDYIDNTYQNITLTADNRIDFANIWDNESGIYFENMVINLEWSCGNQSFIEPNTTHLTSGLPYEDWYCVPYIPVILHEEQINSAVLSLNAAMALLMLGAILLPLSALFLIFFGGRDFITLIIATVAAINLVILIMLFYYIKAAILAIM